MHNDSTTSAVDARLTDAEADFFDKCLEQLFHEALVSGSQRVLVTHQELKDFRDALMGKKQD